LQGFQLDLLGTRGDQLDPVVLASTVARAALEKKTYYSSLSGVVSPSGLSTPERV
jgi:hypothetical protein